jgi:hypothetical protein
MYQKMLGYTDFFTQSLFRAVSIKHVVVFWDDYGDVCVSGDNLSTAMVL